MNPEEAALKEERDTANRNFGGRKRLECLRDRKKTKQDVCGERSLRKCKGRFFIVGMGLDLILSEIENEYF